MSEFVCVSIFRRSSTGLGSGVTRDVHVRACLDRDEDEVWWASADVLYCEGAATETSVLTRLREFPGCVVCAGMTAAGRLILAVRSGARMWILRSRPDVVLAVNQCALISSIVHALLSAGFTLETVHKVDKDLRERLSI
jgi:hypothetical protein